MKDERKVRDDLSYVRSALQRADATAGDPASIYFVWAAITFYGFAIIDFAPKSTGLYWLVAAPLGGGLSAFLGYRSSRTSGQSSKREGWALAMHWGGLLVAVLLIVPLATTEVIAPADFPRLVLLIVALSYFTAGVHLDRRLIPVSLALAACYLLTVFVRELPYLWTVTAAVVAASLAVAGLLAAARARQAA